MNKTGERSLKGNKGSGTSGGNVRKSRKTRNEREVTNKMRFETAIQQLTKENKERKKKAKNLRIEKEPIGETWGDMITKDPEWPGITKEKTLRMFGQNTNGISYKDKYLDWSITMQKLHEYQADVACLVEVNLDLKNQNVKKQLVIGWRSSINMLRLQCQALSSRTHHHLINLVER